MKSAKTLIQRSYAYALKVFHLKKFMDGSGDITITGQLREYVRGYIAMGYRAGYATGQRYSQAELRDAFNRGALEMREEAARLCEDFKAKNAAAVMRAGVKLPVYSATAKKGGR